MKENQHAVKKAEPVEPEVLRQEENQHAYTPATDIYAREDSFVVVADLPGVDKKDLDIHLEENVLTIEGRVADEEPRDHSLLHRDYVPGRFERSFTLSTDVDQDGIEAQFKDGVLRLVLKKSKAAQPRRIKVRTGA